MKSTHVAPFKHVPDEQPPFVVVDVDVDVTLVVDVAVVVVVVEVEVELVVRVLVRVDVAVVVVVLVVGSAISHRTPENPATHEQLNPYGRA